VQTPNAPAVGGDGGTNVLSHALGFIAGAVLGSVVATGVGVRWLQRIPAVVAAAISLGAVPLAWVVALLWPAGRIP
jgi:hypothetical protein